MTIFFSFNKSLGHCVGIRVVNHSGKAPVVGIPERRFFETIILLLLYAIDS